MWPKALLELAPHLVSLVPHAERFFRNKSTTEDASQKLIDSIESLQQDLRGDLGQVTASHASIYRALADHSDKLAHIAADAHATKASTEALEAVVVTLGQRVTSNTRLLTAAVLVNVILLALVIVLLVRH